MNTREYYILVPIKVIEVPGESSPRTCLPEDEDIIKSRDELGRFETKEQIDQVLYDHIPKAVERMRGSCS